MRRAWRPRRGADDLPPAPLRQRLMVLLAALAVTLVVLLAILAPQLELMRRKPPLAQPTLCTPGQVSGCVGGAMPVIVLPASAPQRR